MDEIRRFPRLLGGSQGAALSRLFWTEPTTQIHVAKDGRSINFVFKVRISDEAQMKPFDLYRSRFFEQPARDFEEVLEAAYDKTLSGEKPVHRHISNFLRRVCVSAFEIWVKESWELAGDNQRKERQLNDFKLQAQIKRGPQPNAADAVKVVRLYEKYRTLVKSLRSRVKHNQITKDPDLLVEVGKSIPVETVLSALRKVSGLQEGNLRLLKNRDISTARLAQVITESKLPLSYFEKISFRKYIALGKKLLRDKLWETS